MRICKIDIVRHISQGFAQGGIHGKRILDYNSFKLLNYKYQYKRQYNVLYRKKQVCQHKNTPGAKLRRALPIFYC